MFAHSLANEHENQKGNLCSAIGAVSLISTCFEIMDQLLESTGFSFNYNVIRDTIALQLGAVILIVLPLTLEIKARVYLLCPL